MKIKMELTELEAEALLRIATEAEASAFYEGEMFDNHHQRQAAERAVAKLRFLLQIRDEKIEAVKERIVQLKPVCQIPDCGCTGEAHP